MRGAKPPTSVPYPGHLGSQARLSPTPFVQEQLDGSIDGGGAAGEACGTITSSLPAEDGAGIAWGGGYSCRVYQPFKP